MVKDVLVKENIDLDTEPLWNVPFETRVKWTEQEQHAYINEHWEEIRDRLVEWDTVFANAELLVSSEDEIAEIVAKDRREHYEATHRG